MDCHLLQLSRVCHSAISTGDDAPRSLSGRTLGRVLGRDGLPSKSTSLDTLVRENRHIRVKSPFKGELVSLEKALTQAASIRNGYAHADWIGLPTGAYINVKTRSSRSGVIHRYKKIDRKTARLDI